MSLQDTIAIRPVAETLRRAQAGKSYWTRVGERLLADPVTVTVVALLLCIVVMVLAAPLIATHDPSAGSVFARLKSPGYPGHWLGTDEVGRDLWSRILYGGRPSPLCGVAPRALVVPLRRPPRLPPRAPRGPAPAAASSTAASCGPWPCSMPSRRSCWPSPSAACWAPASATPSSRSRSPSFRRSCASPRR